MRLILLSLLILAGCTQQPQGPQDVVIDSPEAFAQRASAEFPFNRITIAVHGHSVPAGYTTTPDIDTMGAYPQLLLADLSATYPRSQIRVVVEAVGGDTSEQGLARIDRTLALDPDVVILDFALNDWMIGLDRSREAMTTMIDRAKDSGAGVILMLPTPDRGESGKVLPQYAALLRELAREKAVGLCDAGAGFRGRDLDDVMAQSNHPNREGQRLIEAELRKQFVPTQNLPPAQ